MFLYPWSKMVGGIFWEHSHRLIGSAVGLLTVALAVVLGVTEPRRWLRWLGVAAVAVVSLQGVLGGLRVVLVTETLAVLHGALAPAFFALTVGLGLWTSREWTAAPDAAPAAGTLLLRRLALLTTAGIYLQIVLGAALAHLGQRLDAHLAGAVLLAVLVPLLAARILRRHADRPGLVRPALALVGLVAFQLLLGLGTYLVRLTGAELSPVAVVAIPVAHRLGGALLLAAGLVLTLRLYRLHPGEAPAVERGLVSQRVPA